MTIIQKHHTERCKKNGTDPVELQKYKRVFNEEYNLSCHVPKSQNIAFAKVFQNTTIAGMTHLYQQHRKRKSGAREAKRRDKNITNRMTK